MSDSVRPHRRKPTRLLHPWDSPGKNTLVGCHFLPQCRKVKSESEVAQSCPTRSDPVDCSLPGSSVHGMFQARVLEWVAIAFSLYHLSHQQSKYMATVLYLHTSTILMAFSKGKHFYFILISSPYFCVRNFLTWSWFLRFLYLDSGDKVTYKLKFSIGNHPRGISSIVTLSVVLWEFRNIFKWPEVLQSLSWNIVYTPLYFQIRSCYLMH